MRMRCSRLLSRGLWKYGFQANRAGHFPDHEQPKIFAEKVLAFAKAK